MLLTEGYALVIFNLLAGMILGSVLYRSDFCMAGIFRDAFLFRNYSLLRPLLLLVALSMLLFALARFAGLILFPSPPFFSPPSAATLAGGAVFGLGMVLAGGCVVSTLYKMAGGNVAGMAAFIGIIAGSLVYAEFHPRWEKFKAGTILTQSALLGDASPAGELLVLVLAAALAAAVFLRWARQGRWTVTAYAEGYLQPWKAAVLIAVLNTAVYIMAGWPMSITTGYTKLGAYLVDIVAPAHAADLRLFQQNSLSVVVDGAPLTGGAGPRVDIVSLTQLPLFIGIIAGAFLTALALKEFKIYGIPPKRQLASALLGGMLMGLGARMASGCNLTFVLGALPVFAFQGFLFVAAMALGAWAGARLMKRFVIT